MSLETATYIPSLVVSNPDGADARNTADDHLRLLKAVLKRNFPLLDGAVSLSHTQLMRLNDLSASVQFQFNTLRDGSATANNALYANSASYAAFSGQGASASFATLAATANSASYAALAGQAVSASFAILAATANSASYAGLAGTANLANSASFATTAAHARSASFATTAALATLATTATSASSAAAVSGYPGSEAAGASTTMLRNASGYSFAVYYNQSSGAETPSVGHILAMTGLDGYHRVVPVATVGQYLSGQNITGRSGTSKTLASGAGPPSLSGSTNGDFFFYY